MTRTAPAARPWSVFSSIISGEPPAHSPPFADKRTRRGRTSSRSRFPARGLTAFAKGRAAPAPRARGSRDRRSSRGRTGAEIMTETPFVPPPAIAIARANGRIPFGFGSRFFVALVLGLAWLAPAWWTPRLIVAMFLWDALLLAAWFWDLQELPRASQLEVRRIWRLRPALAVPASVAIELRNAGTAHRMVLISK